MRPPDVLRRISRWYYAEGLGVSNIGKTGGVVVHTLSLQRHGQSNTFRVNRRPHIDGQEAGGQVYIIINPELHANCDSVSRRYFLLQQIAFSHARDCHSIVRVTCTRYTTVVLALRNKHVTMLCPRWTTSRSCICVIQQQVTRCTVL